MSQCSFRPSLPSSFLDISDSHVKRVRQTRGKFVGDLRIVVFVIERFAIVNQSIRLSLRVILEALIARSRVCKISSFAL